MSKISCMYIFFVLNYAIILFGMEQQILTLHQKITIPTNVTSISFSKNLPLIAYASKGPNDFKTTVAVSDTNGDHECGIVQVEGNVNFLCFNDRAWYVGMLTNDGVVLVDWQNPPYAIQNQKNSFYSALHFNEGHCYAGTSIGQLFKLPENRSAELECRMPHGNFGKGYENKHPHVSSIAFENIYKRVGLAGMDVMKDGSYTVMNEDTSPHSVYCGHGTLAPMTQSCFDSSGLFYAVAAGKLLFIYNMQDARRPVNSNYHEKYFKYDSSITQLCFDGTDKRLFVGLENGEVYLSELKYTEHLNHPEKHSTLLLQWKHPIKALSFNAASSMLGVATLYKAALFKYLFGQ